jgi:hypothetical protein
MDMNQPGHRTDELDRAPGVCTLVSISCTTAWTDWVHGDLWLCPDGLLRASRGLGATLANTSRKTMVKRTVDPTNRPTEIIGPDERRRVAAADKRNWWIAWDDIARAKQQSGPLSHALHIELTDGRKVSLRWLRQDGPVDFLNAALRETLSDRFAVA